MAKMFCAIALLLLHIFSAQCMVSTGRYGHGFIGYGINMYDPNCAYSCRAVISDSALNCSTYADMSGMTAMNATEMAAEGMTASTSAECYATDDIFLQTLAYCLYIRCDDTVSIPGRESWWYANVAGRASDQPGPKWSYQESLAKVTSPPTETLVNGDPLNTTSMIYDSDYIQNWNAQQVFEKQEIIHERYGSVLPLFLVINY
ncbi:hypothetical protein G7Y89_g14150 [Cudoniella acicularis]|uniref:Uncharacterized protein n=1 Tax=Cudoniella acicularis TaxID=354080 RepID=A0A8H4R8C0_9HELO|nr:hypothetical protein G7Y89_g14150 [Cudoniella acicularis]